ncbi:MAG TPA: CopD family protein [Castellaniella sp.]|nr:CopD family protein [Castellaniella sp.]
MGPDRRRPGAGLSVLWVKTFHILFVVSWFAGLFYLPRIYVNLAQTTDAGARAVLLGMARRLYRFMTPLGVLALIMGLWLWLGYGIGRGQGWMHAKLLFVALLVVDHLACRHYLQAFESGTHTHSHRFFRVFNEIPVVLLLLILILVVTKPF